MNVAAKIRSKALKIITSNIPVKPFKLRNSQPIISFSFDDCPQTSAHLGAEILARYDAAGTYYICGGLTDKYEEEMLCHSKADLLKLIEGGHEIASHLFHHTSCNTLTNEKLHNEIKLNDDFYEELQDDRRLINFSYPFGDNPFGTRRIMAQHFATARGIRPGVNYGVADLSNLYANSIYSKTTSETDLLNVIDKTVDKTGWSIFYTHDVRNSPSDFGSTPEMLEFAIKKSLERGCRILTVRNAIGAIGF